ncbi:hypothetical protein [Chitinimonas lacunae]|uniref:DUF904 domain-containing protein n=1 Tax=Chitinimonas lacunae TaxID=1963018 RepID=A0ABV8MN35_9NEIS
MQSSNHLDRSVLVARLTTLKSEYSAGQRQLAELEARAATLREQLLRINGAAQVLAELLDSPVAEPFAAQELAD